MNERLSEQMAVVGAIDPDQYAASTVSTDVIDMLNFRRVLFIVKAGVLGASATLDFEVNGDTASGGTFATQITGKAITQMTKAGTDDDKQALVEVTAEEVAAQGFRYIRGDLTIGVAASYADVTALGAHTRYHPANMYDVASVDEITA